MSKFWRALLLAFLIYPYLTCAQSKKWELKVGYEQLYIPKKQINGHRSGPKTFKEYFFTDPVKGDLAYVSSGTPQAPRVYLQYNVSERLQWFAGFTHYFRNFIMWGSDFDDEGSNAEYRFNIAQDYGRFGIRRVKDGHQLRAGSFQLGANINFYKASLKGIPLSLGLSNSINFDNYEKSLRSMDLTILQIQSNKYIPNPGYIESESYVTLEGNFNHYNPGHVLPFSISFNHAINLRATIKDKYDLEFQLGYRNIHWDIIYPYKNMHLEYELNFIEYDANGQFEGYSYQTSQQARLPVQLGGVFANVNMIFYPFAERESKD